MYAELGKRLLSAYTEGTCTGRDIRRGSRMSNLRAISFP